jgi:hypothetical protein
MLYGSELVKRRRALPIVGESDGKYFIKTTCHFDPRHLD